jgi:prepilin-type processing-associated H-X9-DG protein
MQMNRIKVGILGLTRIEVIVIIAVVILICSFLAVWLARPKYRMSAISCAGKLQRIGIAFEGYASEHGGAYPMTVSATNGGTSEYANSGLDAYKHFEVFSNSLALPAFLVCPQDNRKPAIGWQNMANSNVSYFVGVDAKSTMPTAILAGDRNVTTKSNDVVTFQSGLKWVEGMGLHGASGHVLFADGHVETLDSMALSNAIQRGGSPTNRIAVP